MIMLFGVLVFLISLIDYRLGLVLLVVEVLIGLVLMWRVIPPRGTPRHAQPEPVRAADEERAAASTVYWQNRYRATKGLPKFGE